MMLPTGSSTSVVSYGGWSLPRGGLARDAGDLERAVGIDNHRCWVVSPGEGAAARDGVVDRIHAGDSGQVWAGTVVIGQVGVFAGGAGRQVVELGEQFVGGRVLCGQGIDGSAQPAHVCCCLHAVPDQVSHYQSHPCPGQRDDVEPIPAAAGGLVAPGHLDGVLDGDGLWEQAALQGDGGATLAGVLAGVVQAHGSPGTDFDGEGEVVLVERVGCLHSVEARQAEHHPAGGERYHHRRVRSGPAQQLCAAGVVDDPLVVDP